MTASIFLLLFSGIALADPVYLNVKIDKNTVTIGDRIKYEVVLEYDDGIEIESPRIAENLVEFEIKDYGTEGPRKIKGARWISRTYYIVTTFATGEFIIPSLKIRYKDLDGKEGEAISGEIKINVKSIRRRPDDKDDIRPLKGPVEIKERFSIWPLILLVLLFIAGISIFIYFKKKRHIDQIPLAPPRPPEEIAMEELRALLEMQLIEKGMVKEYYIRLSDIIRRFIEARFKIFALDRTTWELYQEMRLKRIKRLYVDRIRDFLEECDLVKFAKYIATQKEIEEAYNQAREIVEITKNNSIQITNYPLQSAP